MKFEIGSAVVYVDERGRPRPALLTAIHGGDPYGRECDDEAESIPSVNVVFVTGDASRQDSYGFQIERNTSVVHESDQSAQGMYWRRP